METRRDAISTHLSLPGLFYARHCPADPRSPSWMTGDPRRLERMRSDSIRQPKGDANRHGAERPAGMECRRRRLSV